MKTAFVANARKIKTLTHSEIKVPWCTKHHALIEMSDIGNFEATTYTVR